MDAVQDGPGELRDDPTAHGTPRERGSDQPFGPTHGEEVGGVNAAAADLPGLTDVGTGALAHQVSQPIWFRSETSLWHIWKLTPEGREGIQWTECLEMIDNPTTYAPAPSAGQQWRGTGRKGGRVRAYARVCRRCADFTFHMRKYWIADRPNTMTGPAPTMIGSRASRGLSS